MQSIIKIALVILLLIAVPRAAAQGVLDAGSQTNGNATTETAEEDADSVPEREQATVRTGSESTGSVDRVSEAAQETPAQLNPVPQLVFCRTQGNTKQINVENATTGQEMAQTMGWQGAEWDALLELWSCESQWQANAQNPSSTAFGIAQFLDSTWAGVECVKTADAVEQMRCGLEYIKDRYKTPTAAMAWHLKNNWY